MAVTTSLDLLAGVPVTSTLLSSDLYLSPDVVGFADGSFAFVATRDDPIQVVDLELFGPAGSSVGTITSLEGTNAAITRLTNGSIVVATQTDAGDISYNLFAGTTPIATGLSVGEDNSSNPSVAGLSNGRFVIVSQDNFSSTDTDIDVWIRNADGSTTSLDFTIDSTLADDRNPSVAALVGGGFAVAWERLVGTETEIFYAVFDNDGGIVKAPALLDTTGTINRNVSVTALSSGGFAMIYEDNQNGNLDIHLNLLNAAGAVSGEAFLGGAATEQGPDIAEIAPNIVAITAEGDFNGPNDTNAIAIVLDTTVPAVVAQPGINVTSINDSNTSVAATAPGKLVAFTEHADGTVSGEMRTLARTSTSDAAGDTINGDDLTDIMVGNGGNDTLNGNGGDDRLTGGAAADQISGGAGDDFLVFSAGDVVAGESIDGGGGFDTIETTGGTVDFRPAQSLFAIEAVTLNGVAIFTDVQQTFGLRSDTVVTGTSSVADTFRVDMTSQTSVDLSGLQFVQWDVNADLVQVVGDNDGETIIGSSQHDRLQGGGGNDLLDGGLGADILLGGTGSDRYIVDDVGDVVDETGGSGTDRVESSISVDLTDTSRFIGDIEQIRLTGTGATDATGNGLANLIDGNSAANRLDGGAGADIMQGRGGDDTYVVDNAGDVVDESVAGSSGNDTVEVTDFSVNLADTLHFKGDIEDIFALGFEDITLTGNNLANHITGNDGANQIFGGNGDDILDGGFGDDTMNGGAGNDTYVVDSELDQVIDTGNVGIDTVNVNIFSSNDTTWELAGGQKIEIINIGSGFSGSSQNVIGNEFKQTINGNNNSNEISAGGGNDIIFGNDGDDQLFGEGGDDTVYGGNGEDFVDGGEGGNDKLYGGADNDQMDGLDGNDFLDGGAGADIMLGQSGNDTFIVDDAGDDPRELEGDGNDTVRTSISYTLAADTEIERFETTNAAGTDPLNLTGNGLAQRIIGNAGANTIIGGGGVDRLEGGAGNDVLWDALAGDTDVDTLLGGANDDELHSTGGIDLLFGDSGNDTYFVVAPTAVVKESAGGGTDTVFATGDFTIRRGSEIEILHTTYAGTLGANLTGNEFANEIHGGAGADRIAGNAGVDVLFGGGGGDSLNGGTGIDRMEGGAGDDVFFVDNAGDVVVELVGGGNDTVLTTVSYTLAENAAAGVKLEVENLRAQDVGTHGVTLVGNSLVQRIIGGDGNDTLDGGGGRDRLEGGRGNDTYIVDVANETLIETAGNGSDTLQAKVSFTLAASQSIEILRVHASVSTGLTLTGNAGGQQFFGGVGNDRLVGLGGEDFFTGGGGADTFVFTAAADSPATLRDRIFDFSHAQGDKIDLSALFGPALDVIGSDAFTAAGQVRVTGAVSPNYQTVSVNLDADADAEVAILVKSSTLLVASDFIL